MDKLLEDQISDLVTDLIKGYVTLQASYIASTRALIELCDDDDEYEVWIEARKRLRGKLH